MKKINYFLWSFIIIQLVFIALFSIFIIYTYPLASYTNTLTKEVDYWNDMWAECEFGDQNYNFVNKEYGKLPLITP